MMKAKIEKILRDTFDPQFMRVIDDSTKHADHNPHAKKGGTHFSIEIISSVFNGKSSLERHRMIYDALKVPLSEGVHALAISAKAPETPSR